MPCNPYLTPVMYAMNIQVAPSLPPEGLIRDMPNLEIEREEREREEYVFWWLEI
jgi:hypothetical protein